jgi:hypothetical protein
MLAQARHHIGFVLGRRRATSPQSRWSTRLRPSPRHCMLLRGTFNIVDDEPLTKRDYAAALATADKAMWRIDRLSGLPVARFAVAGDPAAASRQPKCPSPSASRRRDGRGGQAIRLTVRQHWTAPNRLIGARYPTLAPRT